MVANRFGKLIPFLLEPSETCVPKNVQDNLICGSCVQENECLHCNPSKRTGQLSLRKQRHCNGVQANNSCQSFIRSQVSSSVKRKQQELDPVALKRQRKDPTISRSLTPAIPRFDVPEERSLPYQRT